MSLISPATGIYAILQAAGLFTGWNGRVGLFSEVDNCIAILDHPGRPPEVVIAADYPVVQIMIRGSKAAGSYTAAYNQAYAMYKALHKIPSNPAAFPTLTSCLASNAPVALGNDQNERPMFSLNFYLIITQAAADAGYRI